MHSILHPCRSLFDPPSLNLSSFFFHPSFLWTDFLLFRWSLLSSYLFISSALFVAFKSSILFVPSPKSTVCFILCLTSFSAPFYYLTYIFLGMFTPSAHLLYFFVSFTSSVFSQPIRTARCKSFCDSHSSTWPPTLSSFHSHCTMSLLATAITMYHYLASKVTLLLTALRLPLLLPHPLFISPCHLSIYPRLKPPPLLLTPYITTPFLRLTTLLSLMRSWITSLVVFATLAVKEMGKPNSLKYRWKSPARLQTHASLIC